MSLNMKEAPLQLKPNSISQENTPCSLSIYNPVTYKYTVIQNYNKQETLNLLLDYETKIFLIVQIHMDIELYQQIVKSHFDSNFDDIHKIFETNIDFCFSPIKDMLCMNISIINDFLEDKIEKKNLQILLFSNSIYIINLYNCELIQDIFLRKKYNFKFLEKDAFFRDMDETIEGSPPKENTGRENESSNQEFLINGLTFKEIIALSGKLPFPHSHSHRKISHDIISNSKNSKQTENNKSINLSFDKNSTIRSEKKWGNDPFELFRILPQNRRNSQIRSSSINSDKREFKRNNSYKEENIQSQIIQNAQVLIDYDSNSSSFFSISEKLPYEEEEEIIIENKKVEDIKERKNFSTDELIYSILVLSIEKLEELSNFLWEECNVIIDNFVELKNIGKDDFFRKIHSIQIGLQLISEENTLKKRFFKFSKLKFKLYNQISCDFYFKQSFNFFLEMMSARINQLNSKFDELKHDIKMTEESFNIMIDDQTYKKNEKLNEVIKILAILSGLYAPFNAITGIWGMNLRLPFTQYSNLMPFFIILFSLFMLCIFQLCLYRRWKWI